MDPNLISPKQAIASLANMAPFLWPFALLSLGVALQPISPISWSYSTWLLFAIPLIITVFAPIRSFSGPLRFAYLEYASKVAFWTLSLLKGVVVNFQSIPTLALPALFFVPVLPILFFVVFPALPVIWHYIAYHYRRRLKAVTTSVNNTNVNLDLTISRAREAVALAHTCEKQALCTVSTTRTTPLVAIKWRSADLGTPVLNDTEGHSRLAAAPGTLGADLIGKVLDTEKRMAAMEDTSLIIRALGEQAVSVATEGHMVAGEKLAGQAADLLEGALKQLEELQSTAEQTRCTWVEFRQRLRKITTNASATTATLDLVVNQARRATNLAHTHDDLALVFVSRTRRSAAHTYALHDADWFEASPSVQAARQTTCSEAERVRALGKGLSDSLALVEANIGDIESEAENVRALLEQAVNTAVDGDVAAGESLAENATEALKGVIGTVESLCSASDDVRQAWAQLALDQWSIP